VHALQGVDFSLHQGEFVVMLGPSGSGKSTFLHVLSGLDKPDKGEVRLGESNLYALSDTKLSLLRSNKFGFIFQSYNLIQSLTIVENVEIPLRIAGKKNATQRAKNLLSRVGLSERLRHRPGQLSGGEQQRVSIARALACEPQILFADEPTGNLDSKSGDEIMGIIGALVKENNAACVMVTHNEAWAERADLVLRLKDGRLGS